MIKIQVAYKNGKEDKELSFAYYKGQDILEALGDFYKFYPLATVYSVIVCGRL